MKRPWRKLLLLLLVFICFGLNSLERARQKKKKKKKKSGAIFFFFFFSIFLLFFLARRFARGVIDVHAPLYDCTALHMLHGLRLIIVLTDALCACVCCLFNDLPLSRGNNFVIPHLPQAPVHPPSPATAEAEMLAYLNSPGRGIQLQSPDARGRVSAEKLVGSAGFSGIAFGDE
jgi:hypothetical protein